MKNITIWPTNRCNFRCTYCYEGISGNYNDMSTKTADQLICFIQSICNKEERVNIRFHGGEPLLNFRIVKYCTEALKLRYDNIQFEITTNGTLINEEIAEFLAIHFSNISISIDGKAEYHNLHRIYKEDRGTYENTIKGKSYFEPYSNKIVGRMTITPNTVNYLYENVRHLIEEGFLIIEPVPDVANKSWKQEEVKILENEYMKLVELQIELGEKVEIRGINAARYRAKNAICDGGKTSFQIAPDGSIYPCTYAVDLEKYKIGHVSHSEIDQLKLYKIAEMGKQKNETCTGCMRYDYCSATRCKIINKICTGDANQSLPIVCVMENIFYHTCKYYTKCSG